MGGGAAAKIRWRIARLLNRLPGQCWADLASWAAGSRLRRFPWCPAAATCRYPPGPSCYCGKFGAGRAPAAVTACCIRCERVNPDDPCQGCYCHDDYPPAEPTAVARG